MQDYTAAQGVLAFLEVVGWLVVAGALLLGLLVWGDMGAVAGVLVAGVGAIMGVLIVAMVQIARAQIDTALNTRAMLAELRRAPATRTEPPVRADAPFFRPAAAEGDVVKVYRGKPILRRAGAFAVGERVFDTVLQAESFIDGRG